MDHVAILRQDWHLLPKILSSQKTIESRNVIIPIVPSKEAGQPKTLKSLYEIYVNGMVKSGVLPGNMLDFEDFASLPTIAADLARSADKTFNEQNPYSGCPKKGSY